MKSGVKRPNPEGRRALRDRLRRGPFHQSYQFAMYDGKLVRTPGVTFVHRRMPSGAIMDLIEGALSPEQLAVPGVRRAIRKLRRKELR